jgi:hypothetical protein
MLLCMQIVPIAQHSYNWPGAATLLLDNSFFSFSFVLISWSTARSSTIERMGAYHGIATIVKTR